MDKRQRLLRTRDTGEASVAYSELLFDLLYVFAVTQLSHSLLHNLTWLGLARMSVLWLGVWLAWQHTVWVTNWFDPNTRSVRFLLFALMVVGLVMTSSIPDTFGERGAVFAFCYSAVLLGRPLFVLVSLGGKHALSPNYKRILGWGLISACFWIAGGLSEPQHRLLFWAVAVIADFTSPLFGFYLPGLGRSVPEKEWTVAGNHLAERLQLFVIIAFGETVLMSGATLSEIDTWTWPVVAAALVSFANSLAMWWIYFDTSSEAGSEKMAATGNPGWLGIKFFCVHAVLVGSIIICAVGDELVVHEPDGTVGTAETLVLIGGTALYLAANMAFRWVMFSSIPRSHLFALPALLALGPFAHMMSSLGLNAATLAILAGMIVYDATRDAKKHLPT